MAYIGPEPNPGQNREVDDISSGFNGGTAAFTLQVNGQNISPGSSNNIIVSLGGVIQNPGTDYNIAGSTITFTTNPASGLSFFGLVLGQQVDIQSLADGTSPTMSSPTITGDLTVDTSTLKVDASNNRVGIGIASPESVLHVSNAVAAGSDNFALRIQNPTNASDARVGMFFHVNAVTGSGSDGAYIESANSGSDNGDIRFGSITDLTKTERMRMDSAGRLLVGTSSSGGGSILQAFESTAGSMTLGSTTASTGNTATINLAPANGVTGTQLISESTEDFSVSANRSAKFTIKCRVNGNFSDNLVITAAGQQDNLSITNAGDHFTFRNTTTSNTGTFLKVLSSRNTTNGSYFLAEWGSTSTTRFTVLDSGNCANINNSFSAISDQALKENIVDAGSQWDDIKNLKVRKFNFIETTDPDKKTMLGVVAQEAETVCPNLVETILTKQNGEEKEVKSFKYSVLYMKAIKCLQEAQAKIETLETKVAALEAA